MKRVLGAALTAGLACASSGASAATYTIFSGSRGDQYEFNKTVELIGTIPEGSMGWVTASITNLQADYDPTAPWFYNARIQGTLAGAPFSSEREMCLGVISYCGRHSGDRGWIVPLAPSLLLIGYVGGITMPYTFPLSFDYSVSLTLPDGVMPTPLPAALPMMAGVLGLAGWALRRQRASI
ncbi:MAG TPA: hypothetical protein VGU45_04940 [Microvirga sp.]|jgi:hypothetical protein|nr:hypothetical protein [Microvirga sp.]